MAWPLLVGFRQLAEARDFLERVFLRLRLRTGEGRDLAGYPWSKYITGLPISGKFTEACEAASGIAVAVSDVFISSFALRNFLSRYWYPAAGEPGFAVLAGKIVRFDRDVLFKSKIRFYIQNSARC